MAKRLDIIIAARNETADGFAQARAEAARFNADLQKTAGELRMPQESRGRALAADIERRAAIEDAAAVAASKAASEKEIAQQHEINQQNAVKWQRAQADAVAREANAAAERRRQNEAMAADIERRSSEGEEGAFRTVGQMRVSMLEKEAALGNVRAGQELQNLQLATRHAAERERLQQITQNTLVSEQTRTTAAQQLLALEKLQTRELQNQAMAQRRENMPPPTDTGTFLRNAGGPQAQGGFRAGLNSLFSDKASMALLKGAGAAAAFTYAGHKLNDVLEKTQDIQIALASGEITTSQAIDQTTRSVAESLPVWGKFQQAGEKIGNMLFGVNAEQGRMNKLIAEGAALVEKGRDAMVIRMRKKAEADQTREKSAAASALADAGLGNVTDRLQGMFRPGASGSDAIREQGAEAIRQAEAERAEITKRLADVKLSDQDRARVTVRMVELESTIADLRERTAAKAAEEDAKRIRAGRERVAGLEGENRLAAMRADGRNFEADLAAIREQAKKEEAAIRERTRAAEQKDGGFNAELRRQEAAEFAALRERTAMEEAAVRKRMAEARADVGQTLLANRINALKEEAEFGNVAARREAERLEIAKKYNDERRALRDILDSEAASDAQKTDAYRRMAGVDAREKLALDRIGKERIDRRSVNAPRLDARFTDIAGRPDPVYEETRRVTKNTRDTVTAVGEMTRALADVGKFLQSLKGATLYNAGTT